MSSTPAGHAGDTPSTSDVKVGKKNRTIKFPCMLCEGDHHSHLFPHMDEAYYLLEKLQITTGYRNISSNPSLVDGLVNPDPSPVNPVDQVVNLVSSSVEPITQVVDSVPSSVNPTPHLKCEPKVVDPSPALINPTPPLRSSAQVVTLSPSSVNPTPHSKSEDVTQVYLVNTNSLGQGGTMPISMESTSSTQMISIDWNHLTEPHIPSYVPFQITV
jgi:hypothetical protein